MFVSVVDCILGIDMCKKYVRVIGYEQACTVVNIYLFCVVVLVPMCKCSRPFGASHILTMLPYYVKRHLKFIAVKISLL